MSGNGLDPLRNPHDPLHRTGPEAEQELFRTMSACAESFPVETVLRAAINVVLNAIRQAHAKRSTAERCFDELAARSKAVLLDRHYDAVGKRRNIFPFDQVIAPDLIKLEQKY